MTEIEINGTSFRIVDLPTEAGGALMRMPYIHRILLENLIRCGGREDAARGRAALLAWLETGTSEAEIPFLPNRVLMHDTTCGPALVDIAGMRSALAERGIDPALLNPVVPVDVSTDHSVAVDAFGSHGARQFNVAREYERNAERYRFMKWATNTLDDFRVHPPGTGIMHTLNMERLATVAGKVVRDGITWAAPDTLIGTDSHTPMINGIGVLAWGVGGLEAESVLFGMPVTLRIPDVVGVKLVGRMREGVLSTDLALVVTHRLRQVDLQDKYVEFFGPGVSTLTAGDRAVVANMTPEFGGNTGYFPIDDHTLEYLLATGRRHEDVQFVEQYAKRVGLWFDPSNEPRFTSVVELDLREIEPSLAGPSRPQDRVAISQAMANRGILPVAVLSGNRNFPGRVHPQLEAGFLASPPIVIAFALAGTVDIDILSDPLGFAPDGRQITLAMIWPTAEEIDTALLDASSKGDFAVSYDEAEQSTVWKNLDAPTSALYPWDASSTYLRRPPFANFGTGSRLGHYTAHPIMVVGDDVTTDHISPAGAISARSEAGRYLIVRGDDPMDLNVFSSRRGNWEAMVRGLFTNKTVENLLLPHIPPGSTVYAPSGEIMPLLSAAKLYEASGEPVVLVTGERYGMGSSRDWAAKGVPYWACERSLDVSFQEVVHSEQIEETGVTTQQFSRITPNEHP